MARATRIVILIVGLLSPVAWAGSKPPNVLLFFVDDLGYGDLGCYGSTFYETPRIDQLASQSVRFTDFYSASPVCSPTRAALMTGRAPQRCGITQWLPQPDPRHLALRELTLGEAYSEAGYRTGYIGKWHLGHAAEHAPNRQGFSWVRCVNRAGQPASYFHPFSGRQRDGIGYWDVPDLDSAQPGDYLTDKMTDHAIAFLSVSDSARPFFLCFAHYAVHTPIQSPPRLVEQYKQKRMSVNGNDPTPVFQEHMAQSRGRQDDPGYAAMLANLDFNIGRVLDHLEQSGQRDNTIVVLTSDNGGLSTLPGKQLAPTSVRPLRAGKGWTYEGGIRVPLLVSIPAGHSEISKGTCRSSGITMDLYPTLLELCGMSPRPHQHLDGLSLVSAMSSLDSIQRRTLAWYYPHRHGSGHTPSSAIREGRWKLIHRFAENAEATYELYDLSRDLGETENLILAHPEKAKRLKSRLAEWISSTTTDAP